MKQERVEITLKKFKELHKYTLFEMSEHTGLSIALLSKIINNHIAISDDSSIALEKAYPDFTFIHSVEPPSQMSDRVVKTKADNLLEELDTYLRRLDNLLFTARERLKFYENIMRVMGNITWGSY